MINKNNFITTILTISALTCLTSCGTIMNGSTQAVPVATSPMGAAVHVNGMHAGFTPTRVVLQRKQDHVISFSKPGFQDENIPIRSQISGAFAGNLFIPGGMIGFGLDAATGGAYNLAPGEVNIRLRPTDERDDRGYQNHVIPGQNRRR